VEKIHVPLLLRRGPSGLSDRLDHRFALLHHVFLLLLYILLLLLLLLLLLWRFMGV